MNTVYWCGFSECETSKIAKLKMPLFLSERRTCSLCAKVFPEDKRAKHSAEGWLVTLLAL